MTDDWLARAARESRERTARATATYEALSTKGRLKSHRLLTYRCPKRCLLLDVVNVPMGVIFRSPPYKLSSAVNAADSSPSGRAKNTTDGDRHWAGRAYFASECLNVSLNCDHVRQIVLEKEEIQRDLDGRRAEVVVMADGSRRPTRMSTT